MTLTPASPKTPRRRLKSTWAAFRRLWSRSSASPPTPAPKRSPTQAPIQHATGSRLAPEKRSRTPADIAALPAAPTGIAPWDGEVAAVSGDPDAVRTSILELLWNELDRTKAEGDRAFLTRLMRECGSRKLDFPLFPDAALQLDAILRGRDPTVHEVARVVRREPDMVRRVWLEANSVNFSGRVSTLDEAIIRVGFDPLWRLAMRACMNAPVFRVRGYQNEVNQVRAVSIVTADVASTVLGGGDTFLAGLLHGIGKLLVYRAAVVRPNLPVPDPEVVRCIARTHHPSMGVLIAASWKMSPMVCSAIAAAPDPGRLQEPELRVACAVRAGSIAAHTVAEGRAGREVGGLLALLSLPGPTVDAAWLIARANAAWDGIGAMEG